MEKACETMAKPFCYKLKSREGQVSKGIISTSSCQEARTILSTKNLTLISLKPLQPWQRIYQRIELQPTVLLHLFKALAQLCRAGLPLRDALKALENKDGSHTYQSALHLLEQGFPFSKALKQSALLGNDLLLSFIEQGERSGNYPQAFEQIVTHLQWMETFKTRLKKTLSYPIFVLVLSFFLLIFLMSFVVPQLLDLYKMSTLEIPPMTQALLTFSHYASPLLLGFFALIALIVLLGFLMVGYGRHNLFLRNTFLKNLFRLPFFGQHLRDILLLQYTSNMHALLHAQKDNIIKAMTCAEQGLQPSFFRTLFQGPRLYVAQGSTFSQALSTHFPVPTLVLKMLQVGEKSGTLPLALKHVTQYLDTNLQSTLEKFIQRLGPVMLLLVGGFLLFIIAAIFLPLYGGLGALEGL